MKYLACSALFCAVILSAEYVPNFSQACNQISNDPRGGSLLYKLREPCRNIQFGSYFGAIDKMGGDWTGLYVSEHITSAGSTLYWKKETPNYHECAYITLLNDDKKPIRTYDRGSGRAARICLEQDDSVIKLSNMPKYYKLTQYKTKDLYGISGCWDGRDGKEIKVEKETIGDYYKPEVSTNGDITYHARLRAQPLQYDYNRHLPETEDLTANQISVVFDASGINKKYVKLKYAATKFDGSHELRRGYGNGYRLTVGTTWPFAKSLKDSMLYERYFSSVGYKIVDKNILTKAVNKQDLRGELPYNTQGGKAYCTEYKNRLNRNNIDGTLNDIKNEKSNVFCIKKGDSKAFILQRILTYTLYDGLTVEEDKGGRLGYGNDDQSNLMMGVDIDFDITLTDTWDNTCEQETELPNNKSISGVIVYSPNSVENSLYTQIVNLPFNLEMKNKKPNSEFDIDGVKEIYIYPVEKGDTRRLKVAKCDTRDNCYNQSGDEKISIYSKGESTANIKNLIKNGKPFKIENVVIPNQEFNDVDLRNLTFVVGVVYDDDTSKEYSDGDTFALRPAGYEFLKSDGAAFSDKDRASNLKIAGKLYEFTSLGNIKATYCMDAKCDARKSEVTAYQTILPSSGDNKTNVAVWTKSKFGEIDADCKGETAAQTYLENSTEIKFETIDGKQQGQFYLKKDPNRIYYPEVGPSVIHIKDTTWTTSDQENGDCVKDSNSTDNGNGDGKVGCNIENNVDFYTFKPDRIEIKAKIGNSSDISYYIFDTKDPYFSNDEKKVFGEFALAPHLDIVFQALLNDDAKSDGFTAPNLYTGKCYAMNNEAMVDLSSNSKLHNAIIHLFSYDDVNATSKYRAKISENNVKASGNLMAYRALFTNGSKATAEFRVNLNRQFNTPKDPTMLNNLDIKITGGKETQPGSGGADDPESGNKDKFKEFYGDGGSSVTDGTDGKIDGEANVFYGKAYSPSFFSNNKKKDDEPIYYGVYCSADCKIQNLYKNSSKTTELITTDEPSKVTSDGFYKAPSFNTENVENGDADDFVAKKVGSNDDASGKISASNFENNKPKAGEQKVDLEYSKTGRVTIRNYMKDPAYGRTFATKYDETGSANKKYWHEIDATFGSSNNGKWRGYGDEGNVLGDNPERTNAKRFNNRVDW